MMGFCLHLPGMYCNNCRPPYYDRLFTQPTWTTTTTTPTTGEHVHHYVPFPDRPRRSLADRQIYCEGCGDVKSAEAS